MENRSGNSHVAINRLPDMAYCLTLCLLLETSVYVPKCCLYPRVLWDTGMHSSITQTWFWSFWERSPGAAQWARSLARQGPAPFSHASQQRTDCKQSMNVYSKQQGGFVFVFFLTKIIGHKWVFLFAAHHYADQREGEILYLRCWLSHAWLQRFPILWLQCHDGIFTTCQEKCFLFRAHHSSIITSLVICLPHIPKSLDGNDFYMLTVGVHIKAISKERL